MKTSPLLSLAVLLAMTDAIPAQYIRRDINGLEPGESRHRMEEAQRYQRQQAEQQLQYEQRRQYEQQSAQWERDAQWRAQQYAQPQPEVAPAPAPVNAETPDANAVESKSLTAEPTEGRSNGFNAAICVAALIALILVLCRATIWRQPVSGS